MYKNDNLNGGHIIMLGPDCEEAALDALASYPLGLQIGGGITIDNAEKYLNIGASHVIVTSYVFRNSIIDIERLDKLVQLVGKFRISYLAFMYSSQLKFLVQLF
jgi:phosphoribosylformimino-5-aminoimidazole carboxamide ribotide isomerase